MKKLSFILALTFVVVFAKAQTTEDSVKTVINNLFFAMKNGDAALLGSVFADSAILQTIGKNKTGEIVVKNEPVAGFIESISSLPAGAADEQISFETINIDADLASVWTPYKFYFSGKFSHCGVNSFQLVRVKGEWKIQYIIDTRRKINCE
ncbi:MAG: nuclear transport factor 2 family protein [Chitinophagaceae bacterium]|nr:nuclear transport factor 2 family protein [Chitinophagaceae bacterium]